jgi:hypothetical protein
VFPVKYELGFYIPEDGILHIHRRERLRSYMGDALCEFRHIAYPDRGSSTLVPISAGTVPKYTGTAFLHVRFEVLTAVTMKNGVFWDVTPCGSCKSRRFGGTYSLLHQGDKNRFLQEPHGVTSQKTAFFIVTAVKPQLLQYNIYSYRAAVASCG